MNVRDVYTSLLPNPITAIMEYVQNYHSFNPPGHYDQTMLMILRYHKAK